MRIHRRLVVTVARLSKRTDTWMQGLELDMQRKFAGLPDQAPTSESAAKTFQSRFDVLSDEARDDVRCKAGRECLFNHKRKANESLSQRSVRMPQQFDQLGVQGLQLDDEWKKNPSSRKE
ncbi:unnamed protein product [Prorocentrum cordatum]|uniref:Uncharacterized protein n=1 Tax=Prorocentrum cordatum TaxID=2364126 RepID=A0ABN9V1E3_9DINO|nr:unnamed protein product [Polarella glacialis]